jgi:hypothetical protein
MTEAEQVADKLPAELAVAFREGALTLRLARLAETFGLIDVLILSGSRWCPSMTGLGRDVFNLLNDRYEVKVDPREDEYP